MNETLKRVEKLVADAETYEALASEHSERRLYHAAREARLFAEQARRQAQQLFSTMMA